MSYSTFKCQPHKMAKHTQRILWKNINFMNYLQLSFKAMTSREKKGKREIQLFEYLGDKRSFSEEIKSIFYNYLKVKIATKL